MTDTPTLSTREVAARLGCDVSTVRRKRKRGELVAHEVSRGDGTFEWRFPLHLLPPPSAPPAGEPAAPVGAPPAAVATVAPPAQAVDATDRALTKYLLARVLDLERENRALRSRLQAGAPPARTPWWRRLLGRLGR